MSFAPMRAEIGLAADRPDAAQIRSRRMYVASDTDEAWITDGEGDWLEIAGTGGGGGSAASVVAHVQHPDGNVNLAGVANTADDPALPLLQLTGVEGDGVNPTIIQAYVPNIDGSTPGQSLRMTIRDAQDNALGGFTQGHTFGGNPGPGGPWMVVGIAPPYTGSKDFDLHIGTDLGETVTVLNDNFDNGDLFYRNAAVMTATR